jgi:hypothetical protein
LSDLRKISLSEREKEYIFSKISSRQNFCGKAPQSLAARGFLLLRKLWTKKRLSTGPDPFSFSTIVFFIFHRKNVENRPVFFMALRREGAVGKARKSTGF